MSLKNFKIHDYQPFTLSNPHIQAEGLVYDISFTYQNEHDINTQFFIYDKNHYVLTFQYEYDDQMVEIADDVLVTHEQLRYLEKQINALIRGFHNGK